MKATEREIIDQADGAAAEAVAARTRTASTY